MKIIISFIIFCLILFIYLHIQFHIKTSDDLEMYEFDTASKDKFEEICDVRQPVLFDFYNQKIMETTNKQYIQNNYNAFEIKIRNNNDSDINTELFIPLHINSAVKLFKEDKSSTYYSENNNDFLQESGLIKNMKHNDEYLRPYMVSNCDYDIIFGSNNCITPLRYEINYRNFFLLTQGTATIKLFPPKSIRYLYPNYDYDNFEFSSPINPWNVQPQYNGDFDKIKCLEFIITPGKTIYIPAFWWYSIKLGNDTSISCFRYRTYMNNIAISPYFGLYWLQMQNITRNINKKACVSNIAPSTNQIETEVNATSDICKKSDTTNDIL